MSALSTKINIWFKVQSLSFVFSPDHNEPTVHCFQRSPTPGSPVRESFGTGPRELTLGNEIDGFQGFYR